MLNGNVSFWYSDLGGIPARRPALSGDVTVDVCIIGAGYTGLWSAYYLKQQDPALKIAIVEREFAGFGASGRNGGWCSGGFEWSRERYLSTGTREGIIALERTLRGTVAEIKRVTEAEGIDCDFLLTDCVIYACSAAQAQRLREDHAEAMAWDVPETRLQLIDGALAQKRINVPGAVSALVSHGVARIQPAKLVRGLAAVVEALGVTIYEGTAVTGLEKGRVTTASGTVSAHRIIRATEGFTASLPGLDREWLPLNSAQIVTEPVPQSLWDEIGWKGHELLSDASHVYCYAQRTAGNRIAMGGRGVPYRYGSGIDHNGETQAQTIEKLQAILYRMLPATRSLKIDHAWCGVMGVPRDWCATVGLDADSGIAWAGGYVGLGVSTSNLMGQTLADLVLDRESPLTALPWVNRRPRRWEPEPFRWLGVQGMYALYQMADRQEAQSGGQKGSWLAALGNRLTGR